MEWSVPEKDPTESGQWITSVKIKSREITKIHKAMKKLQDNPEDPDDQNAKQIIDKIAGEIFQIWNELNPS